MQPVYAASSEPEEEGGFSLIAWISSLIAGDTGETPRAEFVNDSNDTPDLYVKKTVQSSDPDVPAPEAEFRFTVMIDGDYYAEQDYELYGADGKRIWRRYDMDSGEYSESPDEKAPGIDVPFKTDSNGGFTLKDGQTARFPWVGPGKEYEVFEELEDGSFVQTQPAGGAHAVGHIGEEGSSETFVNTWYPESKAEYADMEVTKSVLLPQGYEMPETPEFEFEIQIRHKPYANQSYTIDGGPETGMTDENGHFRLKGGQTALFSELETGRDYEVSEVTPGDGWYQSGVTGSEGAVRAPVTHVEVTNKFASFAVSKRMSGYSYPDASFEFVLYDPEGTAKSNVQYWLYDRDHKLLEKEAKQTGEDGGFTLKPGETALFAGLPTGTEYRVHEKVQTGYVQVFPEGDFTGTVRDDALPEHEFVNAVDGTVQLTIQKNGDDGKALQDANFKLRRGSGLLNTTYADMTEEDGTWRISGWSGEGTEVSTNEAGQIIMTGFEEGTYTLVETAPPDGYKPIDPVGFSIVFTYENQQDPSVSSSSSAEEEQGDLVMANIQLQLKDTDREDVSFDGAMIDGTGALTLIDSTGKVWLPETGGPGSNIAAVCGAGFLVMLCIGLASSKRSGRRKDESNTPCA